MNNADCRRRFRFLIPIAVLAFVALLSFAVYALWNGVLAEVVPVKTITYWQALGLLVLSKILFGGFPGGRGRFGGRGRERMLAKNWESLDPEQREEMRSRWGEWPRANWCCPERPEKNDPAKPSGG